MKTFEQATKEFLDGLAYLGDLDSATITAFQTAAVELDKDFRTTLLTEYRRQLQYIKAMDPTIGAADEEDPLLSPME